MINTVFMMYENNTCLLIFGGLVELSVLFTMMLVFVGQSQDFLALVTPICEAS